MTWYDGMTYVARLHFFVWFLLVVTVSFQTNKTGLLSETEIYEHATESDCVTNMQP